MASAPQDPFVPKPSLDKTLETLWLRYYNDTLFTKGVITEDERNKMSILIKKRAAGYER